MLITYLIKETFMSEYCDDHTNCKGKITRLEKDSAHQWKKLDLMATKLNFILGGIILSPFIVAVLTLIIKNK